VSVTPAHDPQPGPSLLATAAFPLTLSAIGALGCYAASGASLGVYLGGLLTVTAILPPLLLAEERWPPRLVALSATLVPVAVVWTVASLRSETRATECLAAFAILSVYALALSGMAAAFRRLRLSAAVASALTVVLALAWLTWPIYLSRTWQGEASAATVARLVNVHPGLAINAQLRHLGNWTEQSIAYHLTDLNQTVPFAPPRTVWGTVLFHGAIGWALIALALWPVRPRSPAVSTASSNIA
jgi:hypothetical protein